MIRKIYNRKEVGVGTLSKVMYHHTPYGHSLHLTIKDYFLLDMGGSIIDKQCYLCDSDPSYYSGYEISYIHTLKNLIRRNKRISSITNDENM